MDTYTFGVPGLAANVPNNSGYKTAFEVKYDGIWEWVGPKKENWEREPCFLFVGGFSDPQFLLCAIGLWLSKAPVGGLRPDEPGCAVL